MALERRVKRLEPAVYRYRLGLGPTEGERRRARDCAGRMNAELARRLDATDPIIAATVEQLFASFKTKRQLPDPLAQKASDDLAADGFMIALEGRCAPALNEAMRRILNGTAGLSRTFVPTCAEVADLVDRIERDWDFALTRLATALNTAEEEPEAVEELDDAAREARRAATRELVERMRTAGARPLGQPSAVAAISPAGRVAAELNAARAARQSRG